MMGPMTNLAVCLALGLATTQVAGQSTSPSTGAGWMIKSKGGGGYASNAHFNSFENQLVFSGTFWRNGFLGGAGLKFSAQELDDYMVCFVGVLNLGNVKPGSFDEQSIVHIRSIPGLHHCSAMDLIHEESPVGIPSDSSDLSHRDHNFVSFTTAFLAGNFMYHDVLGLGHAEIPTEFKDSTMRKLTRMEEALALVNTQTLATRSEDVKEHFKDVNLGTIDGNPSLYGEYDLDFQNNGWNPTTYTHQQLAFTYPTTVKAQAYGKLAANNTAGGNQHWVYVGIFQDEKMPRTLLEHLAATPAEPPFREIEVLETLKAKKLVTSSFASGVQKINANTGVLEWFLDLNNSDDLGTTMVSSIVYIEERDLLIVGGSTSAVGDAFGSKTTHVGDLDGFITKIDPNLGKVVSTQSVASWRLGSQPEKTDIINAICNLGDKLYIVGTTRGKIEGTVDGGAFIIKMDADNLSTIWKKQLSGSGIGGAVCDVAEVNGEKIVYIGGTYPNGWGIVDDEIVEDSSDLGIGVFVTKLIDLNGTIDWMQSVRFDDTKKRYDGIKSLTMDNAGHAIAFGNSIDTHQNIVDIFVVSLDRDTGFTGASESPTGAPSARVADTSSGDSSSEDSNTSTVRKTNNLFGNDNFDDNMMILFIVLPILFILVVVMLAHLDRRKAAAKAQAPTQDADDVSGMM